MKSLRNLSRTQEGLLLAVLVLVAFAILFALAEGATRLREWYLYGATTSIEDIIVLHPALGIRVVEPDVDVVLAKRSKIRTTRHGFRNPPIEPGAAGPDGLRLAFLGGSTTFGAEATENDKTWPALVAAKVQRQLPCRKVDFINAAVPGHRLPHSIVNFENRVKPFRPDVVFVYHGHNDLSWESQRLAIAAGAYEDQEQDFFSRHSLLVRLVVKNIVWRSREQRGAAQSKPVQIDRAALARQFEERLRDIVERIDANGALPVLITFSARARAEQPEPLRLENVRSSFQVMPFYGPDEILGGYALFNTATRRVGQEGKAVLVADENRIPGDARHFKDAIHFNDAGMQAMADRVADELLGSAQFIARFGLQAVAGSDGTVVAGCGG